MANTKHTFVLKLEWLDPAAEVKRYFKLFYHVRMDGKGEIELYDVKHRRMFLKRIQYPSMSEGDLFIGGKLNIYGRQMTVLDFENEFTRTSLGKIAEKCFALLAPSAVPYLGQVWTAVNGAGLRLTNLRSAKLSAGDAATLFEVAPAGVADGTVVALELVGADAVRVWNDTVEALGASLPPGVGAALVGAASAAEADTCIEAFFGDGYRGRASATAPKFGATAVTGFAKGGAAGGAPLAPSARTPTAVMDEFVTTVVVLPHAVAGGQAGPIVSHLQAAFAHDSAGAGGEEGAAAAAGGGGGGPLAITALQMLDMELVTAEEFLEVYKHVAPEFGDMAAELSAGLCLAMEVRGADAVERVRRIVGPRDVDIAKQIRPHTLRAQFGVDTVKNAVHCTDLAEDGVTESEYFFSVLQG